MMNCEEWPLIAVLGPTGSGKSDLALELAEQFDGEIVNCDSVQLYRLMDIGTAKIPVADRRGIPHHLIDVLNPDQHFTAGDYARAARQVLAGVKSRARIPVIVGGTGFYLRALLDGLSESPARDQALRERLARRSPASLHRLLGRFDPDTARRIHPNDTNKVLRALELCLLSRQPVSQLFSTNPIRSLQGFRVFKIGLDPQRQALSERINQRCRRMFETGLVDEVRRILSLGYAPDSKALMSIGYRETVLHLTGRLTLNESIERTQAATRRYAKRQRTWFRREPGVFWIRDFGDMRNTREAAGSYLRDRSGFCPPSHEFLRNE